MTEVAHTPGPWEWREDSDSILTMRTLSPGILVLDNDPGCGGPWGDELDRANARLIAAAPDLLAALKELCDQLGEDEQHGDGAFDPGCAICIAHADARAAISKALGAA